MSNPNPTQTDAFLAQMGKNGGKKPKKPEKTAKLYRVNSDTADFVVDYAKKHKLTQGDALDKLVQIVKNLED
jgi:hypothetical protein